MKWKEMTNNLRWTMAAIHLVPCYWPGTLMCTCWKSFHPLKHPTPWESCLVADLIEHIEQDRRWWTGISIGQNFPLPPKLSKTDHFIFLHQQKIRRPSPLAEKAGRQSDLSFSNGSVTGWQQKVLFVTPSHEFQSTRMGYNEHFICIYVCIYVLWFVSSRAFAAETFLWKKASKTVKLGLVGWDILYVQIILADLVGLFLLEAVSRWRVCF